MTEKGQGIPEAAADPVKSHSGTYWLKPESSGATAPTYSEVFGREVIEILPKDDRVVVITPAMLALMTTVGPPDWATRRFPTRCAIMVLADSAG